jgi:hypothetical protein
MKSNNIKKAEQLGIPYGTANGRLRKQILFKYVQKCGDDICFQCGEVIAEIDNFSIEHKIPWLDSSPELFWDLDNIAFSHLKCNCSKRRRSPPPIQHGIRRSGYRRGCRCEKCCTSYKEYHNEQRRARRKRQKLGASK